MKKTRFAMGDVVQVKSDDSKISYWVVKSVLPDGYILWRRDNRNYKVIESEVEDISDQEKEIMAAFYRHQIFAEK